MVRILFWVVGAVEGGGFTSSGLGITDEGLWVCCWGKGAIVVLCVYVCVSLECFAFWLVWWGRSVLQSIL